jgi:uncharacterized protein YndB with AHSA1/START domain
MEFPVTGDQFRSQCVLLFRIYPDSEHAGHATDSQQEVEIRFVARGTGTLVTLLHSGFELAEQHRNYTQGWDRVLGQFLHHAASGPVEAR